MKYLVQQNQIEGLSDRISRITGVRYFPLTGGYAENGIVVYGDVSATEIEVSGKISPSNGFIHIGNRGRSGVFSMSDGENTASIILDSDREGGTNSKAEFLIKTGDIENRIYVGSGNGMLFQFNSGVEITSNDNAIYFSKSGIDANCDFYLEYGTNLAKETYSGFIDTRSGYIGSFGLDDYMGANCKVIMKTSDSVCFLDNSFSISRDSGIYSVDCERIPTGKNPLDIIPILNEESVDIYVRKNCIQDMHIYAEIEKIGRLGFD